LLHTLVINSVVAPALPGIILLEKSVQHPIFAKLQSGFIMLLTVAIILGIMIVVHEFGHFIMAKLLGVRVEQFAIGFGKRLIGFRRGETDYRINAVPLGGYVKMSGETPLDKHTGDSREFTAHPRWHRFLIAIAGPAMNILFAVVLMTGVFMSHFEYPAYLDTPSVIGYVVPDSPAAKAGFQEGDRIIRAGDVQSPTWRDTLEQLVLNSREPLSIAVQRGTDILDLKLPPPGRDADDLRIGGLMPSEPVEVATPEPNMPAAKAGLRTGDVLVAVDGHPISSLYAFSAHLQESKDKPVQITLKRNGAESTLTLTAVYDQQQSRYRAGFGAASQVHVSRLGLPGAFVQSLEFNRRYSKLVLELLEKLVQRKASITQLSSPIGIAVEAGKAVREPGWIPIVSLTALISLQLGIFNLLPIPILDGGLILLLFIESLMRRDISQNIKERIYQAAFVFLLLIAAVVIYNDLLRTIPGLTNRVP
jgi:regulator of sigma E protease